MKDLKTTIIGAITAGAYAGITLYQTGVLDPKTIAIAVGIAILGYFSSDSTKGGGTTANNVFVPPIKPQ